MGKLAWIFFPLLKFENFEFLMLCLDMHLTWEKKWFELIFGNLKIFEDKI